jgi:rhodanese-related sulfurtransferase
VRTIERDELKELLDGDAPVRLVMTLGPDHYRAAHIPRSEAFSTMDEALAALHPDEDIVVYCSHLACSSSRRAYQALAGNGFARVRRYAGGLTDWHDAGLPLEGTGRLGGATAACTTPRLALAA